MYKLIPLILVLVGCFGTQINIKDIETSMNNLVGKPFSKLKIDKLINETDDFQEYETELGNGCTWAVKVNKKTNIVESWRITSDRRPCENGITRYSH